MFTSLYYYCNRELANLFYENGNILKTFHLPVRHIVIKNVSRQVTARPLNFDNRRKLQKLPVFLYRSAPEPSVIHEYKHKVENYCLCFFDFIMAAEAFEI
jgi:hypothetical protein